MLSREEYGRKDKCQNLCKREDSCRTRPDAESFIQNGTKDQNRKRGFSASSNQIRRSGGVCFVFIRNALRYRLRAAAERVDVSLA